MPTVYFYAISKVRFPIYFLINIFLIVIHFVYLSFLLAKMSCRLHRKKCIQRAVELALSVCNSYNLYYHFPSNTCHYLYELHEFYGEHRYMHMLHFVLASTKWLHPKTGLFSIIRSKISLRLGTKREISVTTLQRGVMYFENVNGN
jgi:hypothetical protein